MMRVNSETDYNKYCMKFTEFIFYMFLAAVFIMAVSYLFFRSLAFSIILVPLALFYPKIKKRSLVQKRKKELNLQFRDMLYALASNLSAGKSLEMSFADLPGDLKVIYPDSRADIIREAEIITGKIHMNIPVEIAFSDFAERSHLDNIKNFADVLRISKRMGGDMVEVIVNASNLINDKIETEQEIEMILARKKFEQKVLNIIPIVLIFLLSYSAPDYMEPVFTTMAGRVVMIIAVFLLAIAYFISGKIMNIKV